VSLISKYERVSKDDIRNMLLSKLPEVLTPEQKENKVDNLLTKLTKLHHIVSVEGKTKAKKDRIWKLIKDTEK
jgi:hypothetical protein